MREEKTLTVLTNGDVIHVLGHKRNKVGTTESRYTDEYYQKSREAIIGHLLARDQDFGRPNDKTKFDLSPLTGVRDAIRDIYERALSNTSSATHLSRFRCSLIAATAHVSCNDADNTTLCLFLALMERHWERVRHAPPDPDYCEEKNASAAGQYLLRCLAVHATYANFSTYVFVLEQFERVTVAIKRAILEDSPEKMLEYLLPPPQRWLVIGVTNKVALGEHADRAMKFGRWLATQQGSKGPCAMVAIASLDGQRERVDTVASKMQEEAEKAGGAIFVEPVFEGKHAWAMTNTKLTLAVVGDAAADAEATLEREGVDGFIDEKLLFEVMSSKDEFESFMKDVIAGAAKKAVQPSTLASFAKTCASRALGTGSKSAEVVRGLDQAVQFFLT